MEEAGKHHDNAEARRKAEDQEHRKENWIKCLQERGAY